MPDQPTSPFTPEQEERVRELIAESRVTRTYDVSAPLETDLIDIVRGVQTDLARIATRIFAPETIEPSFVQICDIATIIDRNGNYRVLNGAPLVDDSIQALFKFMSGLGDDFCLVLEGGQLRVVVSDRINRLPAEGGERVIIKLAA